MDEMKTLTIGKNTFEVVDEKARMDISRIATISEGGKSINLFNLNDSEIVTDNIILNNGNLLASNGNLVSGYIPVENGKSYTFPVYPSVFGWGSSGFINLYNGNKERLGTVAGAYVASETDGASSSGVPNVAIITVTINNTNAGYIRTVVVTNKYYSHNNDNFMVVEGTTYPSEYVSYGDIGDGSMILNDDVIIPNLPEAIEELNEKVEKCGSVLYGKTVVFTGDSICNASTDTTSTHKGWAGRIGTKHNMNWTNAGISGATITSKTVTGSTGTIADTNFGENPDYIIIEGGTNDADYIGGKDTSGNMPAEFGSYNLSNYGEFNTSTFCGAVEYLFKRVTTDYAGAKIGFIIAHKMGGWAGGTSYNYSPESNDRRYYFETIITLCKKWGIPYINLWDGCYLNPQNPAHNSGDNPFYSNQDRQHLTARGYDYISPMIEKWMETL